MCNPACIEFVGRALTEEEVRGKDVIEVGSRDVNGSARSTVESLGPASYLGIDIEAGSGVDEICNIDDLADRYGPDRFDVVLSTELLEHVRHWRIAVSNLKTVLKPGGTLLITTRSTGFGYHAYPFDFWRYDIADVELLFSDLEILTVESDPVAPGIFVKARKSADFTENDLDSHELYSILRKRRCREVNGLNIFLFRIKWLIRRALAHVLPGPLKRYVKKAVLKEEL